METWYSSGKGDVLTPGITETLMKHCLFGASQQKNLVDFRMEKKLEKEGQMVEQKGHDHPTPIIYHHYLVTLGSL